MSELLQRDFADQGAGGAFGLADHPQGRRIELDAGEAEPGHRGLDLDAVGRLLEFVDRGVDCFERARRERFQIDQQMVSIWQTHRHFGDVRTDVERGLSYLMAKQNREGDFGGGMYAHGLATIAVCEAYGLTSDPRLKPAAQRAVSLHLYSRPYDSCVVYSDEQHKCGEIKLSYTSEFGIAVAR